MIEDEDLKPASTSDTAFIGHPKGLGFLAGTEMWERFSFYGMQTLLVLYMTKYLLLPGHVENVLGLDPVHHLIEQMYGKALSPQALASAIFGLYAGAVYLTPIFGGLLADGVLGRRRTITIGALLMALGHFLMAFDVSFLMALACLILGSGCFKGNIATQVGELYAPGDKRRADAFQIFYLAINAGVIAAPLVAGTLGQKVAWHYGFGAAGIGMLIGLAIYLMGGKHLPVEHKGTRAEKRAAAGPRAPVTTRDVFVIILLILLLPVLAIGILGNQQIFNAYIVWTDANANFNLFGWQIPSTWLITLDTIASVSALAGAVIFWRWWAKTRKEPDEITKIAIGCIVAVLGLLCLAAAAWMQQTTGQKVSLLWLVAFHVLNSIGFANVFPVALALYSRTAPPAIAGTIIGIFYLHLFAANNIVGYVGGLLEKMPATTFWLMHAAFAGGAGLVLLLVRLLFGWLLYPKDKSSTEAPAAEPA